MVSLSGVTLGDVCRCFANIVITEELEYQHGCMHSVGNINSEDIQGHAEGKK